MKKISLAESRSHTLPRSQRTYRWLSRIGLTAIGVAIMAVVGTGSAFAHVTVNPDEATAGSYAKLTFRVPTESDTASTTALAVQFPTDIPIASVSVMQIPGWTSQVSNVTLDPPVEQGRFILEETVSEISWTADDGVGINPGEFAEFPISVGPVPDAAELIFLASQTYSDGTIVEWNEVPAAGESAANPAPRLTINAKPAVDDPAAHLDTDTTGAAAQLLGAIGVALGAVALVIALIALRQARKQPTTSGDE